METHEPDSSLPKYPHFHEFSFSKWAEQFRKAPVEEMSGENAEFFIKLSIAENENRPTPKDVSAMPMFRIIKDRSMVAGLNINDTAACFLMLIIKNPAAAVMYIYGMRYMQSLGLVDKITMQAYGLSLFSKGFIQIAALRDLWEAQKAQEGGHLLNALDRMGRIDNGIPIDTLNP